MGEGNGNLLVIGVGRGKAVGIAAVQLISLRSCQFLYIELIAQRKVCCKLAFSVCPGGHLPDQRILLHDDRSGIVFDFGIGIQAVNRSANRRLCQLVLLQCINFYLLTVIVEGCRPDNRICAVTAFRQGHRLALALVHVIGRRTGLRNHIGSEGQVVQDCLSVLIGCECRNRSPLLIDNRSVSCRDIRTGRYAVLRSGKLCRLILEGRTIVIRHCPGQDRSFFVHLQGPEYLIVRNGLGSSRPRRYRHAFRCDLCAVTLRRRQLLQIYSSGHIQFHSGRPVRIRRRHLGDQLCAGSIGVDSENRTGEFPLTGRIRFHNSQFGFLHPGHINLDIFLFLIDCLPKHQGQVLRIRSGCDLIRGVILRHASLHLCMPGKGYILRLCQRSREIELRPTVDLYLRTGFTGLARCFVVQLHASRQLKSNGL